MAGPSTGKVFFTGDTSNLEAATKRVGKGFNDVEQVGGRMANALSAKFLSLAAVANTIAAAAGTIREKMDASIASSKSLGSGALRAELAGQRLGIGSATANNLLSVAGSASAEDRAGFLEGLAGKGRKFHPSFLIEATKAFSSGLVTKEEAEEAARNGKLRGVPIGSVVESRRAGLTQQSQREDTVRNVEAYATRYKDEAGATSGLAQRLSLAGKDVFGADSPTADAFRETVKKAVPFVGEAALDFADRVQFTKTIEQGVATGMENAKRVNYSATGER
jgi:hypothetical protein